MKLVLLYNFDEKTLSKLRRVILPLKMGVKVIKKEDYSQSIGCLAGIKGLERIDQKYVGDELPESMLVMNDFTNADIDTLLRMLAKNGLGNIPHKAVITKTNLHWSGIELYEAVRLEDEQMKKNKR